MSVRVPCFLLSAAEACEALCGLTETGPEEEGWMWSADCRSALVLAVGMPCWAISCEGDVA